MRPGARVLLGITGGIAAYKSVLLARELQKRGAEVRAILTPSAKRFIGVETLRAITREQVPCEVFQEGDADVSSSWTLHIHWAEWADLMVIAPCTANTLGKLACGLSDNLLTSAALALRGPLLVCPTMDGEMYRHPAVQRNLQTLQADGAHVLPPEQGYLASGQTGQGRLPETQAILSAIESILGPSSAAESDATSSADFDAPSDARPAPSAASTPPSTLPLQGRRVLVTAGPTREPIDAVRFLSNPSTGKMGIAMARAARDLGADVHLLLGPTGSPDPSDLRTTRFTTAEDLFEKVRAEHGESDVIIMCAAVSDFRPATSADTKTAKADASLTIALQHTPDILAWLGRNRTHGQRLVGFAMETHQAHEHAREKLRRKAVDAILMNELREGRSGFATDRNELTLIREGSPDREFQGAKSEIALQVLNALVEGWREEPDPA